MLWPHLALAVEVLRKVCSWRATLSSGCLNLACQNLEVTLEASELVDWRHRERGAASHSRGQACWHGGISACFLSTTFYKVAEGKEPGEGAAQAPPLC